MAAKNTDFAWVSQDGTQRKFQYKISGRVSREHWLQAWADASAASADAFEGGPTSKATLGTLRKAKPSGIVIKPDGTAVDVQSAKEERAEPMVLALGRTLAILEDRATGEGQTEGPFRVQGVALFDEVLSSNGAYYSKKFNDLCMATTNRHIEAGGVCTVFARHGDAGGGFFAPGTGLPVGRIESLFREGADVCYVAAISATTRGKDVQRLIEDGVMLDTSVRIYDWEVEEAELPDGTSVQSMTKGILGGVDFAPTGPGILGAGVEVILEEGTQVVPVTHNIEEEDDMEIDWTKVTLEELKEHTPELLVEHAKPLEEQVASLTEAMSTLQAKYEDAAAFGEGKNALDRVGELVDEVEEAKLDAAVALAALQPLGKQVYEELKPLVTLVEDLTDMLVSETTKEVRQAFLAQVTQGAGLEAAKGKAAAGAETRDRELTEEAQTLRKAVLHYSKR